MALITAAGWWHCEEKPHARRSVRFPLMAIDISMMVLTALPHRILLGVP